MDLFMPQPTPKGPLQERLKAQRDRFCQLKEELKLYEESLYDKSKDLTVHLQLEMPIEVEMYLKSIEISFESLDCDAALSKAISSLAIRLYKTDKALEETIESFHVHNS